MARTHKNSSPNEEIFNISTNFKFNENATDLEADENLRLIGISEKQIDEVIEAAQAVLDMQNVKAAVVQIAIQELPPQMKLKCQCGSRCVSRACVPYTAECGGSICHGHSISCIGYACNPCADSSNEKSFDFKMVSSSNQPLVAKGEILESSLIPEQKAATTMLYRTGFYQKPPLTITKPNIGITHHRNVTKVQLRNSQGGEYLLEAGYHHIEPGQYVLSLWGSTLPDLQATISGEQYIWATVYYE